MKTKSYNVSVSVKIVIMSDQLKDYVLPPTLMFIQSSLYVKIISPVTPMKTCYAAWHQKQGGQIIETSKLVISIAADFQSTISRKKVNEK